MTPNTDRIFTLVNHLWPSTKFEAVTVEMPFDSVRVLITKEVPNSFPTYLATVDIEQKHPSGTGYAVRVNYPGFNGTVDQMKDSAEVIALLVPFMAWLNEAAVIKGE